MDSIELSTPREFGGRDLGPIGIWSRELRFGVPSAASEAASELEELGFGALWIPGGLGGALFEAVRSTLRSTSSVTVATGILNIWMHDPAEVAFEQASLEREHPGRFLLGLGVGHARLINSTGPQRYRHPLTAMAAFLDTLDELEEPEFRGRRVLAALAPQMASLASKRSAGVHPYMVPVEHTRWIRELVGPQPVVAPALGVVSELEIARARDNARRDLGLYLSLPNYTRTWLRLGFSEADLANRGSDRLVDALYAYGSPAKIAARVREHLDAGADHVCLRVVTNAPMTGVDEKLPIEEWRELAQFLL